MWEKEEKSNNQYELENIDSDLLVMKGPQAVIIK